MYSIKDIQHFLLDKEILWNGKSKPLLYPNISEAEIKFFDKVGLWTVLMEIDELTFKIYTEKCSINYQDTNFEKKLWKDFSIDWIQYKLHKYPEGSALLRKLIANKKKQIHQNTKKELEPIKDQIKKIKEQEKEEISYWNDIDSIIKTTNEN